MSNCSQMCAKMRKIAMISDNYCDIGQLLLLTIIVSSKNWTISIIFKENITVNRQNQLITHPYFIALSYVTGHEKIGLMCTQNLTTFLNFKLQ